jgi:NADH-quinone oxidoreductase subunit J
LAFNLIFFYLFAAITVGATLLVVVQSNPVYSVLLLIASFIGLGGLYVLLDAPFVAVVQIIVYAGAIMVLFLFVVMLLNAPREQIVQSGMLESGGTRAMGGLLAMAFAAELAWALTRSRTLAMTPAGDRPSYSVAQIGQRLFQEYAFAFEATSILILVAMVGALTLAGRHLAEKRSTQSPVPTPKSLVPNPESRQDHHG